MAFTTHFTLDVFLIETGNSMGVLRLEGAGLKSKRDL